MMRVRAFAVAAALALTVACNNQPTSPNIISNSNSTVAGFVASVASVAAGSSSAVAGVLHGGTVSFTPGGPTVTPTGPSVAANAGAVDFTLQGSVAFSHVFVSVANTGQTTAPSGFYELDLTAPVSSLTMLISWVPTIPTSTFTLQFQVTDANGNGQPAVGLPLTMAASVVSSTPTVTASYSPNPATFLGGAACTLSLQQGCLWEFEVLLQELNGVGVANATMNETYTFGSQTITNALTITIPAHGMATIVRSLACGTSGTACATPAELAGGTYTYTITGADTNGNAFSFTGPVLTLSGQ